MSVTLLSPTATSLFFFFYFGTATPRPRPPPGAPRPLNPPRSPPPLGPPGPPPRGLLMGRSPRSFLVSTKIFTGPVSVSIRTPPEPPWGGAREAMIARFAESRFTNSRKAHALLRTTSTSLIGPNRCVMTCLRVASCTFSSTPYTTRLA